MFRQPAGATAAALATTTTPLASTASTGSACDASSASRYSRRRAPGSIATASTDSTPATWSKSLRSTCEPGFIERRGFQVDVRRFDLDGRHVERAPGQRGQDFLGDADPVGEVDVDPHSLSVCNSVRRINFRTALAST